MGIVFVESERCTGNICPGSPIVIISLQIAFLNIKNIASTKDWSLSACTIIRHKEDKGIFKEALFFQ